MLTRFDKKAFVIDLPLCRVYLEDEANYPWLFLVPRREGMGKIMDLDKSDQLQLIEELDWAQRILTIQFNPTQVNVAAIGKIQYGPCLASDGLGSSC
jgi:diadenosine tetraphosphate (Ap4A) HIT family hydrolase